MVVHLCVGLAHCPECSTKSATIGSTHSGQVAYSGNSFPMSKPEQSLFEKNKFPEEEISYLLLYLCAM